MNDLVYLAPNTKEPFTTSEVIAECAEVKHHAIQQLIQKHKSDFRSFGLIAFEMRKPPAGSKGGRPETIYRLNEQQATLLMTYLRNTPVVREFIFQCEEYSFCEARPYQDKQKNMIGLSTC